MTAADDQRDALALIRATIEGDQEAAEVILDHADLRAVAEELAFRASCLAVMAFGSNQRALAHVARVQHDWAADEADT